jgi:hypothetical protein
MAKTGKLALALLAALIFALPAAYAADHIDGPAAALDPAADITDVFAWMSSDAARLYMVMALTRDASTSSRFSDQVQYVFHTTSQASFGGSANEVDIICQFDVSQRIQCWAGDDAYVTGDASGLSGISTSNGRFRVFAGLRNDAFFFNLAGFNATRGAVRAAAPSLRFDPAGCPALPASTAAALVNQLQSAPGGGPARDSFANFNVLAIVVSIDKAIVTGNGPIVGVWGSTNRR